MRKKIYNKKKFFSGITFLLLATVSVPITIMRFNDLNALRNTKSIILNLFCILIGITAVYRSLSLKCVQEDEKNSDEREYLVKLKSKSSAFDISFSICLIITVICMVSLVLTKNVLLGGIFIGMGIVPVIMIIVEISSCFYHDKRN